MELGLEPWRIEITVRLPEPGTPVELPDNLRELDSDAHVAAVAHLRTVRIGQDLVDSAGNGTCGYNLDDCEGEAQFNGPLDALRADHGRQPAGRGVRPLRRRA